MRKSRPRNWLHILSKQRTVPPEAYELEVSVFGPGRGESIAVHLGAGEWIIVDSCIDQVTKTIPVLDYLTALGVDVSTDVKLVVGTHAHDDHIAGLGTVFDACKSAVFVLSGALTLDEFLQGVNADADIASYVRPTIFAEYRRIFEVVKTRPTGKRMKYAVEMKPLYSREESIFAPRALVLALSPSDETIDRGRKGLAKGLAVAGERRRLNTVDPNELAVAILVEVGDTAVVLGADLLKGPAGCGWEAVVNNFQIDPRASVFKVPHHGSDTGHHDRVWTELLTDDVVSMLAPFRFGRKPLPAPEDIERLKSLSKAVYSSANPKRLPPTKAVRQTRAAIGIAADVRVEGTCGQVRARRASDAGTWEIETFDPAMRL